MKNLKLSAKLRKTANAKKAKKSKFSIKRLPGNVFRFLTPDTKILGRWGLPVIVALVLVIGFSSLRLMGVEIKLPSNGGGIKPVSVAEYKEQLRQQADDDTGAPQSGRSPSNQLQTGLSDAASQPNGTGTRTDTPASGLTGSTDNHHDAPANNSQETGINSAGCYIDYGIQGQECLPAHAATNGTLTCSDVRNHGFPDGIKVTGTDRFKLDKNGDKIACGAND